MKHRAQIAWIATAVCILSFITTAMAKTPKVHLTGPPKERAQFVNQEFTIGILASSFDYGWVEVISSSGTQIIPMERKKTNYIKFTPAASGELTITAVVMMDGDARQWQSSIITTVYPVDAKERAEWMIQTALSCVGSTDAAKFVQDTNLRTEDDWCAAFIGWCAKQIHIPYKAGLQAIFAGVDVYDGTSDPILCRTCKGNHKARFLADVLDPSENPQPGDLVFFIWDSKTKSQLAAHPGYLENWHGNANHVGIVTSVTDHDFTFVHGNIRMKHNKFGVAVNQSTDAKDGKTYADWVVAFARPHYDYQSE